MSGSIEQQLEVISHYLETQRVEAADSGLRAFAKNLARDLQVGSLTEEEVANRAQAVYINAFTREITSPEPLRRLDPEAAQIVRKAKAMNHVSEVLQGGSTMAEVHYLISIGSQAIEDAEVLRGSMKPDSFTIAPFLHFKQISRLNISKLNGLMAVSKPASTPR